LPEPVLTEEERAAKEAAEAAAAAAASEAAAKAKGKKGNPEPEATPVVSSSSVPLFPPILESEVMAVCSLFLVEVALLDTKASSPHNGQLQTFATQGMDIATKVIELLAVGKGEGEAPPLHDAKWTNQYGRCCILQVRVLISRRKYQVARALLVGVLQLLGGGGGAGDGQVLNTDARGEATQLWLSVRDLLVDVCDRQSRLHDAITMSTLAAREAASAYCGFWLRCLLFKRARVHYKLGNLRECLVDCDASIDLYEKQCCSDITLLKLLALKATVTRDQAVFGSVQGALNSMLVALTLLRRARTHAESLARSVGYLGADCNISYTRGSTAVMEHHLLTPVMHSLTDIHPNEPALTLYSKINPKKLAEAKGVGATMNKKRSADMTSVDEAKGETSLDFREGGAWGLRNGPVDAKEFESLSPSEFANIYLAEVRALTTVYSSMCLLLDDIRLAGIDAYASLQSDGDEVEAKLPSSSLLLREQIAMGEDALKMLRQVVYAPPLVRASLLLSVGKTRAAIAKASGGSGALVDGHTFLSPLFTCLEMMLGSAHPWQIMRAACIQLVDCYGDRSLDWGEDGGKRMRMAVHFLLCAIKLNNMSATVTRDALRLASDRSFTAAATPVPEPIATMLSASTCSSATLPRTAAVAEVVVDPKAKGGKGAPAAVATAPGPDGRDAVFLLSSLLREGDALWLDSYERDDCIDMHLFLKKGYALYAAKCCLAEAPSLEQDAPLAVPLGTISSLWLPVKMPEDFPRRAVPLQNVGLYSHVSTYLVLGAKNTAPVLSAAEEAAAAAAAAGAKGGKAAAPAVPAPTTPIADPVLTKLVLLRCDVVKVEKELRDIRGKLVDAEAKSRLKEVESACAAVASKVLKMLIILLTNGFVDSDADQGDEEEKGGDTSSSSSSSSPFSSLPTISVIENSTGKSTFSIYFDFPSTQNPFSPPAKCELPLAEDTLAHLADVFSFDKDMLQVVDNDVCVLLRSALGYRL